MTTVVALASLKGGSGKTTLAINLAVTARLSGCSAAIVDLDPQGSAATWRQQRKKGDVPVRTCDRTALPGLLGHARRHGIEFIFLDTPPRTDAITSAAIRAADLVIVPTRPAVFDLTATARTLELVRSIGRPRAVVLTAAPPRRLGMDAALVTQSRSALENIHAPLCAGQITHRLPFVYAIAQGLGVQEFEPDGQSTVEIAALWNAVATRARKKEIV